MKKYKKIHVLELILIRIWQFKQKCSSPDIISFIVRLPTHNCYHGPAPFAEAWREWLCGREACPLRWMDGRALLSKEPQPEKEGGALHNMYIVRFHLGSI
jgi:hypothetical protein